MSKSRETEYHPPEAVAAESGQDRNREMHGKFPWGGKGRKPPGAPSLLPNSLNCRHIARRKDTQTHRLACRGDILAR